MKWYASGGGMMPSPFYPLRPCFALRARGTGRAGHRVHSLCSSRISILPHGEYRHLQMRRILPIVINRVVRHADFAVEIAVFAGVEVAVEAGEVAAGDRDTDTVAGGEAPGGGPEVDLEAVDFF